MSKNVEISAEDWQRLVDLHEKYASLMFEAMSLLQSVSYTATIPAMGADALRLFRELEPFAKLMFVEDPPFGIHRQN